MLHERDIPDTASAIHFWVKKADREMMRHLRLALPGLRQEKEEPQSNRKKLDLERNVPIGQPQVKEASIQDLPRRCEKQTRSRSAPSR